MALKRGDILDERKRFPDSCGLVVKIGGGGDGFHAIQCCGHELTEADVVPDILPSRGRKKANFLLEACWKKNGNSPILADYASW
ncbi:MAG: hypothetical protein U0231_07230 [Nitrospiraceae bacterium]